MRWVGWPPPPALVVCASRSLSGPRAGVDLTHLTLAPLAMTYRQGPLRSRAPRRVFLLADPASWCFPDFVAIAAHDDSLSLLARHLRYARREAARRERELEAALAAAHAQGVSHRRLAQKLLATWGVRLSSRELARFTAMLRKKVSRARTRSHNQRLPPSSARRSRASGWPFEREASMNERVVRRTTTTVIEELDQCPPCAVPASGTGENLAAPTEREGATCPRTPPADDGALSGEVVDLREDALHET